MDIGLRINIISPRETYTVRHPVLRPGRPLDSCIFEGDDLETTFHLGGFYNNRLAAVATFMERDHLELGLKNAGQVRGMAVLNEYHGMGFGKLLLNFGEKVFLDRQIKVVWLNAREIALPFYKKCGYSILGEVFRIPDIGNHFVMYKHLT